MEELHRRLIERIKKSNIPAHALLKRFRFIDESLRTRSMFSDQKWVAFWYDLGREIKPKRILSLDDDQCLYTSCVVLGAEGADVAFSTKYTRFAKANLKIAGGRFAEHKEYDFGIAGGDFSGELDLIWGALELGGVLCVTNAGPHFEGFAKAKNRSPIIFNLRHNVGLLRK